MLITDVKIRRLRKDGKMKGVASITIDNEFVVHDIKVIESETGLFIAMPSRKDQRDGEYRDIAHPINVNARHKIQTAILTAFEALPPLEDLPEVAATLEEGTAVEEN